MSLHRIGNKEYKITYKFPGDRKNSITFVVEKTMDSAIKLLKSRLPSNIIIINVRKTK